MGRNDATFNLILAGIVLVIALATGIALAISGDLDEVVIVKDRPSTPTEKE